MISPREVITRGFEKRDYAVCEHCGAKLRRHPVSRRNIALYVAIFLGCGLGIHLLITKNSYVNYVFTNLPEWQRGLVLPIGLLILLTHIA